MKSLVVYYSSNYDHHKHPDRNPEPELRTRFEDVPIPDMGPHDVLIKVVVAGLNHKDWQHPLPQAFNSRINQGDDVAGTVEGFGHKVRSFKFGERVAGLHRMGAPGGSYAEYCICPEYTVFRIPDSMSYEEGATIPLAAFTAAVGLYRNLRLPMPFELPDGTTIRLMEPEPLLINGASGAVGSFVLKLAKLSPGIRPIIAIAGANAEYVKAMGADVVLDYRSPTIRLDLANSLHGRSIRYAFDCFSTKTSVDYILACLDRRAGRYTCTTSMFAGLQEKSREESARQMMLEMWHGWWGQIDLNRTCEDGPAGTMFAAVFSKVLEMEMEAGRIRGHPYEIVPGGLNGVLGALKRLRNGDNGNRKLVVRIADTDGLS